MDIKTKDIVGIIVSVIIIIVAIYFAINSMGNQYKYNCFENDTIKNITEHQFNCVTIDCTTKTCITYRNEHKINITGIT